MPDSWEGLAQIREIIAKPQLDWSSAEDVLVWETVSTGEIAKALHRYVNGIVRSAFVSREIVDTCITDLAIGRRYKPEADFEQGFRAWLMTSLRNHIARYWKRLQRAFDFLPLEAPAAERLLSERAQQLQRTEYSEDEERGNDDQKLAVALSQLDGRAREVIDRRLQGCSFAEIAQLLGVKESHARVIHTRATDKLRTLLANEKRLPL